MSMADPHPTKWQESGIPEGRRRSRRVAFRETPDLTRDAQVWTARRVALVAALWLLGAALLALLSIAAHAQPEFPGDAGLTSAIQGLRDAPVAPLVNFASAANWPGPAGVTAVAVVVVLTLLRHVRAALCAAVAAFGADLANVTLNGLVARPRPSNVQIHVVAHLGLHSFPSGHVTHVVGLYGFILYLTFRALWLRAWPKPLVYAIRAVCLYFLICIGPSRVLQGEHWPSDVLASYLLGALVLVVAVALYHLLALAWLTFVRSREAKAGLVGA